MVSIALSGSLPLQPITYNRKMEIQVNREAEKTVIRSCPWHIWSLAVIGFLYVLQL